MRLRCSSVFLSMLLVAGFGAVPSFCDDDAADADAGAGAGAPSSKAQKPPTSWEKDPSTWKVTIYPIYIWAPVMGASVNLPTLPTLPNRPGQPSTGVGGTVSGSFNGAGFPAFEIMKSKVKVDGGFLFASLSADRTSPDPKIHMGTHFLLGQADVGYEILKGLYLEGGFRRLALSISLNAADRPGVHGKPGFTDPLIGATWKHLMGKRWMLSAHLDGGGFGVGSDVDIAATGRADWRFARHFGMTMGFGALHFQKTVTLLDDTRFERTLKTKQTLYGPIFGFGIYF